MLDPEAFRRELLAQGKLSAERLAEAEAYARANNLSLAEALTSRLMISFQDLGACCSLVSGLPYLPVAVKRPDPDALRWMSAQFASRVGVFPASYDPADHALTVVLQDPAHAARIERIYRFLLLDTRLNFAIASDVELKGAAERLGLTPKPRLGGNPGARPNTSWTTPKPDATPTTPPSPQAAPKRPEPPAELLPAYAEMSQSLTSMAMLLVRLQLSAEPERVHSIRTRVRYCQLMAQRLKLSAVQSDALVLAAWFSVLDRQYLEGQLVTPFKLDELLFADDTYYGRTEAPRIEGRILSLVRCYQELKREHPDLCREVNLTRRELLKRLSAAHEQQAMLETFLQILVDEEFLEKLGRSAGRILIVDPQEVSLCTLAPPLMSVGYDVIAMPDTRSASGVVEEFKPDLVLVSADDSPDRVLWFCEKLKGEASTAGIPILAVVGSGDPQLPVRCLRAGANDFLMKPVHPELLFLKVQNHLSAVGVEQKDSGVSGTLGEMSFTDLIQILCAGRRSVDICINSGTEEGRVFIREGDVVHAQVGTQSGESAFYVMMQWKQGTFTSRHGGTAPERTIHASAMALLMEGSRQADEG